MPSSRDYPKLLSADLQEAIRDHDLAEAVAIFEGLIGEHPDSLELWAELLDELAQHGHSWTDWAEAWPRGEAGLERAVYFLVLGIQALQEEAFEHASFYLHRCAETAPKNPVPLAYLGIMFESQGCPTEALAYYDRCLTIAPQLFSVLNAVGNLYHELGFYEEAVSFYRRAYPRLVEPTNQAILLGNLGNSLRALGQVDQAIAAYTEAIALDPCQSTLHIALAETLLEARRTINAIGCLTDLILLPPFDEWPAATRERCYGLLSRAYWEERQYAASILFMWLRNGGRLNEEDREGVSALLKALFRWSIGEPGRPVTDHLLAKLNRHLGYFEAALHHAKRAVKAEPGRVEHFLELGAALMMQGKLPVALEAFDEAANLAPELAEVQALRALALWELDPDLAKEALEEAARLEPNQALHHCDLAFAHQVTGDEALVQESFQQALLLWDQAPVIYGPHGPATHRGCYTDVIEPYLAENANSPEAATRLLTAANFLILSRRREPARKALHRLLSEQPTHLDALRNYAWLLMRQGWNQEALSIWRKVLMIAPGDDVSRYFALTCLSSGGLEGKQAAIRELDRALAERPDNHLHRLLLAKLLETQEEGLLHLEMLTSQLPLIYTPWYVRGQCHFHRGELDEARDCLERAVSLNPGFVPARQLLAQCHQALGQEVEAQVALGCAQLLSGRLHLARIHFDEALLQDPDHPDALEGAGRVERRLRQLEDPTPEALYRLVSLRYRI